MLRSIPRILASAAVFPVLLALAACTTVNVQTDWDPAQDFGSLRSYAWVPGPQPETGNARIDSELLDRRVRRAVDRVMGERGFSLVEPDDADFLVAYHIALDTRLDVRTTTTAYNFGHRGRWGPYAGTVETTAREYELGTLIIDFATASERRHVWRGTGSQRVRESRSPEQADERMLRVVEQILARFPPA